LVFDENIPNSLKASTRKKRVLPSLTVHQKWQGFFRSDDNKKELYSFLSEQVVTVANEDKQVIATNGT